MGKKVKKKVRSGHKEKRIVTPSQSTILQQNSQSTETVDEGVLVSKEKKLCSHLHKGVDLAKLSSKIGASEPIRCEDCREGVVDRRTSKGKDKHGKKRGSSSADSRIESKAIWVCLECGHFSCGGVGFPTTPQSHAVRHARQTRHPLAIQFENPHLQWCFPCSSLIPHEKSEENGEQRDLLSDIVKMIKGRSSVGASADVGDVWFGSGSLTSDKKSDDIVSSNLDGRGSYVVRGLVNLGNTCFFNSIMQNLLAMSRLRDYFSKLDGTFGPLTVALKKLYNETSSETDLRNVINPRTFFGCVCAKAPQFRGYQQHDSHELLRCLLDGLCLEESSARKQITSSSEDGISPNVVPTVVDAIFGGCLSSTVFCLECGHSSTVYEPFLDLSLPVPTKKPPPRKAQPISRAKKSKVPPKRSGRVRSKVRRDTEPVAAQTVSNRRTIGESSCQEQSSLPLAGKMVGSLSESTLSQSYGRKEEVAASSDLAWLDYLEPDTVLNDSNSPSQIHHVSVIQDSGTVNATQNQVSSCNNVESSSQARSFYPEKTTDLLNDLTWLDYAEPDSISDNHDMASQVNDELVIQNSGDGDAKVFLQNDAESNSWVCSSYEESNQKVEFLGNSWEDELQLQVLSSEVLLLPYKEETSPHGDIVREEGDVSSSAACYEQDSLEFDGFGDLFNEPDVSSAPKNDDGFQGNEIADTGFTVGNSSESDPGEVDNTDSPVSIDRCLAYFTKPELLANEHGWHCENCSKALHLQRMKSRKRQQKPMTNIRRNEDGRIQNAPLGSEKDYPSPAEVRNVGNGNINGDAANISHEELISHNERIAGNEKPVNENIQKVVVSSQPEDERRELNHAPLEPSQSTSSHRTCNQSSFSDQSHESDGCEDEEMDSESVKVKRDATKRILINRVPPILTIHLKRFCQDGRGRLSKLNGHVDFRDTIDLRPYMDPRCTEREMYKYRLVGVVEHLGTMRGGHYVAYVRGVAKATENTEGENGEFVWYHASDAYVREASLDEVLRCEAYILFYESF